MFEITAAINRTRQQTDTQYHFHRTRLDKLLGYGPCSVEKAMRLLAAEKKRIEHEIHVIDGTLAYLDLLENGML